METNTKIEMEDAIKKAIDSNRFASKDQLMTYLHRIYNERLHLSSLESTEIIKGILKYYDDQKGIANNVAGLNLDGVSELNVYDNKSNSDKKYIKINNPDGTYTVLDDNLSKDNFVKQFNDKQNENKSYQTSDGIANKQAIIKDIKENQKEEVNLETSTNVDNRELSEQEKREFAAVMGMQITDTNNFIINSKNNIYINRDTGDTYYVYKNSQGQLEVRKAEDIGAKTISNDSNVQDDNIQLNDFASYEINQSDTEKFHSLSDDELQYIMDNPVKFSSLTEEQKELIKSIINERKQNQSVNTQEKTMEKQKVYSLNKNNTYLNGFASIACLAAITMIYGVIFLLIIMNAGGMLK